MLGICLAIIGGFCLLAAILVIMTFTNSKDDIENGKVLKEERRKD